MVKYAKKNSSKSVVKQGQKQSTRKPAKITANTSYELCDSTMTAFGGLLTLEKFLDLVNFKEVFASLYRSPSRKPVLGCYTMVYGFLMLLFIGFSRIGHFWCIRKDSMVCRILGVECLPAISTFWRYLISLGLNQSKSILNINAELRSHVWQLCGLKYETVHINIDTTVSTVYGNIEGSRKGHNTKHRGKKGLRPIFLFIEETREYLCGTQRRGTTMSDEDMAKIILEIRSYLPATVKKVLVKGDAEFIGSKTIAACLKCGFLFIFANKRCAAEFEAKNWYTWNEYDYNETLYQPCGWDHACRFIVMRIGEDQKGDRQLEIFEKDQYMHRVFATNISGKPHTVIVAYDKRASIEGMIKEAQQEGILAIPSRRFLSNHAFFQIVMLTFNIWRWMKLVAAKQIVSETKGSDIDFAEEVNDIPIANHTIRIARLKILFVPAKIASHEHKITIKYSTHDERSAGLLDFMKYMDNKRAQVRPWNVATSRTATG